MIYANYKKYKYSWWPLPLSSICSLHFKWMDKSIFNIHDMKLPHFAFYPSDFLYDTMELTDAEIGQYMRLICKQWKLKRLKKSSVPESLRQYFTEDDKGFLFNERLEKERTKAITRYDKSMKGADERWKKAAPSNAPSKPTSNAQASPKHMQSESELYSEEELKQESIKVVKKSKTARMDFFIRNVLNLGLEKYGTDLCEEFINYWTESEINSKLFRAELSKNRPFDIVKRLITWKKNDKNWKKNGKSNTEIKEGFYDRVARKHKAGEYDSAKNG